MYALIRLEIKKIISQKKSWMGIIAILIINALFVVGFIINKQKRGDQESRAAEGFLVNDFMNANFFTQMILSPSLFLIMATLNTIVNGKSRIGLIMEMKRH